MFVNHDEELPAALLISNDPYAHQDDEFRKHWTTSFESREPKLCHPFDAIEKANEECRDGNNIKESELEFVNNVLASIPLAHDVMTKNQTTSIETCAFYDQNGAYLHATTLTPYQLNARFEFVVTPNGSLISKANMEVALIERPDQDGQPKYELARLSSIFVTSAADVCMRYRLFNDDSTFTTASCDAASRTAYLGKHYSGIYQCPSHPILTNYTQVCRKLAAKTHQQRLNQIGVWSRARKITAAFVSTHVMDVADFLEFYHIRAEWMWHSRLGAYVCATYIQPLLNLYTYSNHALNMLSIARNACFLDIKPYPMSPNNNNNVCMLCGSQDTCTNTVILDGRVFVVTDMKCAIALYLMCLIPNTLVRFRKTDCPNPQHYELLKTVFAHAHVQMQTLQTLQTLVT